MKEFFLAADKRLFDSALNINLRLQLVLAAASSNTIRLMKHS